MNSELSENGLEAPQPSKGQNVSISGERMSKLRRPQADIGCVLGTRGPALLYIVKSDWERNRFGQFCGTLAGLK